MAQLAGRTQGPQPQLALDRPPRLRSPCPRRKRPSCRPAARGRTSIRPTSPCARRSAGAPDSRVARPSISRIGHVAPVGGQVGQELGHARCQVDQAGHADAAGDRRLSGAAIRSRTSCRPSAAAPPADLRAKPSARSARPRGGRPFRQQPLAMRRAAQDQPRRTGPSMVRLSMTLAVRLVQRFRHFSFCREHFEQAVTAARQRKSRHSVPSVRSCSRISIHWGCRQECRSGTSRTGATLGGEASESAS